MVNAPGTRAALHHCSSATNTAFNDDANAIIIVLKNDFLPECCSQDSVWYNITVNYGPQRIKTHNWLQKKQYCVHVFVM